MRNREPVTRRMVLRKSLAAVTYPPVFRSRGSVEWDYRRAGYRAMAVHLRGTIALEEYDRVFSLETAG